MGYRNILECDNPKCRKELTKASETYEVKPTYLFKSDRFTDAAGSGDNNYVSLYFCEKCVRDITKSLKELLHFMKLKDGE